MPRPIRILTLKKETLRTLMDSSLNRVQGGSAHQQTQGTFVFCCLSEALSRLSTTLQPRATSVVGPSGFCPSDRKTNPCPTKP